jgi:outer membrane protein OmpA-like peptidoglycan-associated protein
MGFISKRLEAYVDVEGCILCFEGISNVRPGVTDNLTDNNDNGSLLANIEMERLLDGQVLAFSNIYYDYNKVSISDSSLLELDRVALFLKDNPGLTIELGSHTDSKGQKEANLRLSQKRAQMAVDYLIYNGGIAPHRLQSKGYGESNLLNHCKDGIKCSTEEHSYNRRTEFKIVSIDTSVYSKSLREIKVDEMMSNLLEELGNTQIVINEGEDIDARIKIAENGHNEDQRIFSDINTQPIVMALEDTIRVSTSEINNRDSLSKIKNETDSSQAIVEVIEDDKTNDSIEMVPKDYTGYKIAIKFSRFALKKDDKIFKDQHSLYHFITADRNHLYLIGHFSTKRSAEAYLKTKVQRTYPNAYIAGYEKGVRTY